MTPCGIHDVGLLNGIHNLADFGTWIMKFFLLFMALVVMGAVVVKGMLEKSSRTN